MTGLAVVTGAFGYTGRQIASRLLAGGVEVRTLTNHPQRGNPFGDQIEAFPLSFDDHDALVESLRGADVLYNTYWVRFRKGPVSFEWAVRNSLRLFAAARHAGVSRVVHIGITNPHEAPDLPYFRGKATLEDALAMSSLSYGIVRPTLMFGYDSVFISNLAWLVRTFPVFPVPGAGRYRLQPVAVDDVADLCIEAGSTPRDVVIDAGGPEIFTFEGLLRLIRHALGRECTLLHVPPRAALLFARLVGVLVRDVVLTKGELEGLMRELIVSREPPRGRTSLTEWFADNASTVGLRYVSELARNYKTERVVVARRART